MFARSTFGNQAQPFAFGASPFTAGAGFGGIPPFASQTGGYNPLLQFLASQLNPVGAFGGYSPVQPQIGNHGFNPYQSAQMFGTPIPPAHLLAGLIPAINPAINPLVAAQLAAINPGILPNLLPQIWGGAFGQQSTPASSFSQQIHPGLINPLFQPTGGEAGYFGQSPFVNPQGQLGPQGQFGQPGQFGWNNVGQGLTPFQGSVNPFGQSLTGGLSPQIPNYNQFSPFTAQDPITATLLAQQLSQQAQQRLPIRPLTGQPQVDPYQIGLSGITGLMGSQSVDPYAALTQAQLLAQCAVNPMQQMARANTLGNWAGSPYSMGQASPINQTGVPFNL